MSDGKAEIVIVRRKGAEEVAAHKGGAWKIAYADFVTAMMAFFLVMWLINAANEATRAQVASYFNPIKLTDSATGARGLNDPKEAKAKDKSDGSGQAAKATAAEKAQELQVLADPAKTLDKVAGSGSSAASSGDAEKPVAGAPSVPSDPFDPLAWQSDSNASAAPKSPDVPKPSKEKPRKNAPPSPQGTAATHAETAAAPSPSDNSPADAGKASPVKPEVKTADNRGQPPVAPPAVDQAAQAEQRQRVSAEIRADILKRLKIDPAGLSADIRVTATPEGQLISLTDRTAFGMFQLGSAEPGAKMVTLVATIAAALKDRPGYIVVRGHTDSHPYRSRSYDNWQLSTARAQMAYYMLLRGGLDAERVRRIEGYADRQPLIPDHPDAPENRRIDILIGQDP